MCRVGSFLCDSVLYISDNFDMKIINQKTNGVIKRVNEMMNVVSEPMYQPLSEQVPHFEPQPTVIPMEPVQQFNIPTTPIMPTPVEQNINVLPEQMNIPTSSMNVIPNIDNSNNMNNFNNMNMGMNNINNINSMNNQMQSNNGWINNQATMNQPIQNNNPYNQPMQKNMGGQPMMNNQTMMNQQPQQTHY